MRPRSGSLIRLITAFRDDDLVVVLAVFLAGLIVNGIGTILFFELLEWLELKDAGPRSGLSVRPSVDAQ